MAGINERLLRRPTCLVILSERMYHFRAGSYCSFCCKSEQEVGQLITGPNVYICDECVEVCIDTIREGHKRVRPLDAPQPFDGYV